jgi:MtN3 and saliva related transmembrane protein
VNIETLGFFAAACTTLSFVPQVVLVWREKHAQGISMGMYLIFMTGVALWMWYGFLIGSLPVIVANGCTLILAGCVLAMKLIFDLGRNSRHSREGGNP